MDETSPNAEGMEALYEKMREVGQSAIKYADRVEGVDSAGQGGMPTINMVIAPLERIDPKDLNGNQRRGAEYFREVKSSEDKHALRVDPDQIRYHAKPFLNPETE